MKILLCALLSLHSTNSPKVETPLPCWLPQSCNSYLEVALSSITIPDVHCLQRPFANMLRCLQSSIGEGRTLSLVPPTPCPAPCTLGSSPAPLKVSEYHTDKIFINNNSHQRLSPWQSVPPSAEQLSNKDKNNVRFKNSHGASANPACHMPCPIARGCSPAL